MQAIEVKFVGASATKGDRVIAFCSAKRKIYSYNGLQDMLAKNCSAISRDNVARLARQLLCKELSWSDGLHWHSGTLKNGNYVFVGIVIPKE